MQQYLEFVGNHPYLFIALAITIVFIVYGEYQRRFRGFDELSATQAILKQNHENALFLDIRERSEYSQGHLVECKHIVLSELDKKLSELDKYKQQPLIVYCASGNRSLGACAKLKKAGFESVYSLAGGLYAWQKANLPVVTK
ncbi:MAG: rhodanese-like domain-containing protein [Gammaproteobacteria bacterium]|nr:rhodanese-like domain-containing protein [Gammaproteobacteria bacterium]